jgi:hypothetical protein
LLSVPSSRTNYAGATVSFSVTAQGSYPITYQWYKNGVAIPGAVSSVLTLGKITSADQAAYSVRVSNGAGNIVAPTVNLIVVPITATGYQAAVLGDGPAAYFPLDDDSSAASIAEIANFGAYQGLFSTTLTLQQPGAGSLTGYSSDFDGASQGIVFDNYADLNFTGQVTLEAWVKPASDYSTGGYGDIIAHGYGGSPTKELVLRISSGNYGISSYDGTSYGVSFPVPSADIGAWVYLVGTYDGTAWNLYRNGVLSARSTNSIGALTVDAGWGIGSSSTGLDRYFQGSIDEVAIYPAALTSEQVIRHFLAANGKTAKLGWARAGSALVLTWNSGQLQEATAVAGPWKNVDSAASPFTVQPSETSKFYRLAW